MCVFNIYKNILSRHANAMESGNEGIRKTVDLHEEIHFMQCTDVNRCETREKEISERLDERKKN